MTKNSFIAEVTFKMMLTKHIFDYHPIPEKKQIGGVEDMEFQASRNSRIN